MRAGTEFRKKIDRGDALALLAVGKIRELRKSARESEEEPIPRCVYILRSLKHPDEVRTLRKVYGPGFLLVGAYSPRNTRVENLAKGIAQSHHSVRFADYLSQAEALNKRDEEEGEQFGQYVRETFPMADVFISAGEKEELERSVDRFVRLLFGHPYETPTPDEYAMFVARGGALRSGSLSRQVGAAIAAMDGEIVALGTNEVPKAGGGLYGPGDKPDGRDWKVGYDTSDLMKRNTLAEIVDCLSRSGWLTEGKKNMPPEERVKAALPVVKGTQLMRAIEYGRSVHAEMAALLDAARHGVAVKGCTLYTTTFPCHDCARHIVASGIKRVVYIEPYPKSLALEFHEDSIAVDTPVECGNRVRFEPFVGIAPGLYMDLFTMGERKKEDGTIVAWPSSDQMPRLEGSPPTYLHNEYEVLAILDAKTREVMS